MCERCETVHFVGDVPAFTIEKSHVLARIGPFSFSTPLDVFRMATAQQQVILHEHDSRGRVLPFGDRPKRGRPPKHN
jgi:hypothetical protein